MSKLSIVSLEERKKLCGRDGIVRLNGRRARIVGALCERASVYALERDEKGMIGQSYEFEWEVVARAVREKLDLKV
jgi:hypothetical protein